ncbi:hypothetical protein M8S68_10890, partial [Enterobacter roggenkampii]|nr:hypothetical protein [Enterobacter roggenkampii]
MKEIDEFVEYDLDWFLSRQEGCLTHFTTLLTHNAAFVPWSYCHVRKRTARTVLTGMCYSVGSVMRQGSSS